MIYTVTLNPAVDRELIVPAILFDTALRAEAWRVDCGGKGFNVSRMLMSLGTPSVALAFAGGDSGRLLEKSLQASGIKAAFEWVDGETRTNVSIITRDGDHYIKVNEPGPTIDAETQYALLNRIGKLASPGDWWVLSGSLPPGVPVDYYAKVISLVRDAGAAAILDASDEALRLGCMAGPMLVKPNESELETLTGPTNDTDGSVAGAAGTVQLLGAANVAVSMGRRGALLLDEVGQAWRFTSPPIVERNPIGAGDSLVGGLVWGLDQGLDLVEAMRWGIACGAAAAARRGTVVGERRQVENLLKSVRVTRLD